MDLGLRGRRVLITGGSRGIGRAMALEFADEGAHIAICARGAEALQRTADEIRAKGVKIHAETCDVADADALDALLIGAHDALGGLDVLVHNASGFGMSDDDAGWQLGFDVDLMAGVRAVRRTLPWLEKSDAASIVLMSSTAALEAGAPGPYSAAKAAVISYSKQLAIQLAEKNIRVNCIAPGSIDFPGGMWDDVKSTSPERYEAMRASIPFGRLGTAEEVARAAVFVASPAASWVTGCVLSVDGGQHRGNL